MADLVTAPAADAGTTGPGPAAAQQTTGPDPETTVSGQAQPSTSSPGSKTTAKDGGPEESFFDPSGLAPELVPAYKQMQGHFTKKMKEISQLKQTNQQKLQAYDSFTADPVGAMQRMAAQYGLKVSRAEAAQMSRDAQTQAGGQAAEGGGWVPQTWEEVEQRAAQRAKNEIMQQFAPIITNVQQMRAHTIERQLDELDPEWRTYEDSMRENLQKHPTLVEDVSKLYRLSVPDDVSERKATQRALAKLEAKTKSGKVSGSPGTTHKTAEAIKPAATFDEAVAQAKRQLAEQGRR